MTHAPFLSSALTLILGYVGTYILGGVYSCIGMFVKKEFIKEESLIITNIPILASEIPWTEYIHSLYVRIFIPNVFWLEIYIRAHLVLYHSVSFRMCTLLLCFVKCIADIRTEEFSSL